MALGKSRNGYRMEDVREIKALIARQFASLSWPKGGTGNWSAFSSDFVDGATLYPAARPFRAQDVSAFVARMKRVAETELQSLEESILGTKIIIFGNIAAAVRACAMRENETTESRTVEMLLLVKDGETWRIAAQAWDRASDANPIPAQLLTNDT
jgi:hypothetical protein